MKIRSDKKHFVISNVRKAFLFYSNRFDVSLNRVSLLAIACSLLLIEIACQSKIQEDHSKHLQEVVKDEYTCPMHPEIIRDKAGGCPICGMALVKKEKEGKVIEEISLSTLIKPTNEFIITSLPLVAPVYREEPVEIDVLGYTAYNTSSVGTISARVGGRIEKLYVKYRYQKINKGQRIMDIYSPELMTSQQNLLFLLKNDSGNTGLIQAAKQRLLLLGYSNQQLQQLIQTGKASFTVAVYSNYAGHIHETNSSPAMDTEQNDDNEMINNGLTQAMPELTLREGMYLQKGQSIFTVYDPSRLWILLNIYPQDQAYIKVGDKVRIVPEAKSNQNFRAAIDYIEPFFRKGSKTMAARINYNNSSLKLPVGSQVKATIFSGLHKGLWLPKEAVLILGMNKVVLLKTNEGFRTHTVQTGHIHKELVHVTGGLQEKDSVAADARYLIDSESFIKLEGKQ